MAAIILGDESILLVKRAAEPGAGKWSIPGGSVEIGESLEVALKREVMEETGLDIEVGDLVGVSDLIVSRDERVQWHYVLINYYASIASGKPSAGSDLSECRWVELSELRNYDVTNTLIRQLERLGLVPRD